MHISASVQRNRQGSLGKSAVRGQAGAEPRPPLHVFTSGIKGLLADTNLWPMYDIRQTGPGWLHRKLVHKGPDKHWDSWVGESHRSNAVACSLQQAAPSPPPPCLPAVALWISCVYEEIIKQCYDACVLPLETIRPAFS